MRDPAFWWTPGGWQAALLSPFAALYGTAAGTRMRKQGERAPLPVVCVGNFTLGGAGKTPTAIALAKMLIEAGKKPAFVTRGYGGSLPGPVAVDAHNHKASEVGDEPLLLAHVAPTYVSRDRAAGAQTANAFGAGVVILDDGLQNPSLQKDFTLVVVDARRGIGNGHVFPAGPLRAPLGEQIERCDAVLFVGDGRLPFATSLPVFHAQLAADETAAQALHARKALAFAGIGDPEKFFATLDSLGVDVAVRKSLADHHVLSAEEASALAMQAEHENLELVTTEKDFARMAGNPDCAALRARTKVLPVTMKFVEEAALRELLLSKIRRP